LRIVPPWTFPIGFASTGIIWLERVVLEALTGFDGLLILLSSRGNLERL